MKITYFGHSSFGIETDKIKILTDPYYYSMSAGQRRLIGPQKPEKIYDYILISHEHFDHCDTQLIDELYSDKTKIITTSEASHKISHPCHTLNEGMEYSDSDDHGNLRIHITALRAKHPQSENPIGFYFFLPEPVYFAGDTYSYVRMGDITPPFLAFIPIGGEYTADSEQASEIASLVRPEHIIPMHYNTWDNIKADPGEFARLVKSKTMATHIHALKVGETVELKSSTNLPRPGIQEA